MKITLENLIINSQTHSLELNCPNELEPAKNIWELILKYFDDDENFGKIETSGNSFRYWIKETPKYLGQKNDSITSQYNTIDKEKVKNILEGNAENDDYKIALYSIFYNLIYFSIFPYNGSLTPRQYFNAPDDIHLDIYQKKTDDDGNEYYCFNNSNALFDLMDKFNPSWSNYSTRQWLIDGKVYVKGVFENKDFILFPDELAIKEFIFKVLVGDTEIDPVSIRSYLKGRERFKLKDNSTIRIWTTPLVYYLDIPIGQVILSKFISWIIETIDSRIKNAVYERSEDKPVNFTFESVGLYVESCQEDIKKFHTVYKYGSELLKKYVNFLVSQKDFNSENLIKDENVKKLLDKLIGCKLNKETFEFKQNTNTKIFDAENNGRDIIKYVILHRNRSENDNTISDNAIHYSGQNFDLTIDREEFNLPDITLDQDFINILKVDRYLDQSLFFYEKEILNRALLINTETKEEYESKINEFCKISGSVIAKVSFLCIYKLSKRGEYAAFDAYKKIKNKKSNIDFSYAVLNGSKGYNKCESLYSDLGKALITYWNNYLQDVIKTREERSKLANTIKNLAGYTQYEKSKIAYCGYHEEDEYFYINDGGIKKFPSNVFVDIQFKVPEYTDDGKIKEVWIPVTSARINKDGKNEEDYAINKFNKDEEESYDSEVEMHAGSYFDSFEITDKGASKEIDLVLKCSNDLNLEKIIYNSMSLESKKITSQDSSQITFDNMIRAVDANFKIRFGYLDSPSDESYVIRSNDASDESFLFRTELTTNSDGVEIAKPVLVYPWTYFKITGLSSNIKNGEDTYNIKGLSSGGYALNYLSLGGIDVNFSNEGAKVTNNGNKSDQESQSKTENGEFFGSPKNVLGKIIKWITYASSINTNNDESGEKDLTTARICFLGDADKSIISDYDNIGQKFNSSEYTYELKGGQEIKGGNIESIENSFFDTSGSWFSSKSFNIENIYSSKSIKTLLEELVNWLPSRIYYIGKDDQNSQTVAILTPYSQIKEMGGNKFFTKCPYISEKMVYEIIEADGRIIKKNPNGTSIQSSFNGKTNENWERIYFIRMYYKGPGLNSGSDNKEYLRVYNYRSTKKQVIEDINISMNDEEFGNTISTVMILGAGKPVVFSCDESGMINNKLKIRSNNGDMVIENSSTDVERKDVGDRGEYELKPFLFFNNSKFVNSDVKWEDSSQKSIIEYLSSEAANFFTAQQNLQYTGDITITGDPFYYFDSSLEMGVYEIMLQMNRISDYKTYSAVKSRYSGIYYLTGIKQKIDSTGKYTTTLDIVKRVFGEPKKENEEEEKETTT